VLIVAYRRDYGADVSVQNNVDVSVNGQPVSDNSTSVTTGTYGSGVDVDVDTSVANLNVDVDTHIEIDGDGNECEVNSAGVTVRVKVNGVWYPAGSVPNETTPSTQPTNTAGTAPDNHNTQPTSQPTYYPPAPPPASSFSSSSTSTSSTATTPTTSSTTTTTTTPPSTTTTETTTTVGPTSTPSNYISGVGVKGISWDAFMGTDQSCKTPSDIAADIAQLVSYGYSSIRLYGVDCNAVDYALSTLQSLNTDATLIVGVYSTTNYTLETADLINQVNGRWDLVSYVSVFNEAVNDGRATVSEVAIAIAYVKSQVPSGVSVTTIDTFAAFISNPDLCHVGQDFIAANIQPYFSAVSASDAGNYVVEQQGNVANTCGVEQSSVQITGTLTSE